MTSKPIPFLQPDDQGNFHVGKAAADILSRIKSKVVICAVAGPYRTGKSYLLNRLIDCDSGFSVGNTVNACTKGIWMWGNPVYNAENDTTYIYLDTEGLNSTGEEVTFDTQIFSLSVLLSSAFVLNTQNNITESALEQLELVAECSKSISFAPPTEEQEAFALEIIKARAEGNYVDIEDVNIDPQLALHFPSFTWVLRDFSLEMKDKEGNEITPKEYLENNLKPIASTKRGAAEKNRIRRSITSCFINRDCVPLVRPVANDNQLRSLHTVKRSDLRPEFERGVQYLRDSIHHSEAKKINGKYVTGQMLLGLAEEYTRAMNEGKMPSIMSAWQSVLEVKVGDVIREGTNKVNAALRQAEENIYDTEELEDMYCRIKDLIVKRALEALSYDHDAVDRVRVSLDRDTEPNYTDLIERNRKRSFEYCQNIFADIYSKDEELNSNQFKVTCDEGTIEDIEQFIMDIQDRYDEEAQGPGKVEVRVNFTTQLWKSVAAHLITSNEEAIQELNDKDKEVDQLNKDINELEEENNEMIKVKEELDAQLNTSKQQYLLLTHEFEKQAIEVDAFSNEADLYKQRCTDITASRDKVQLKLDKTIESKEELASALESCKIDLATTKAELMSVSRALTAEEDHSKDLVKQLKVKATEVEQLQRQINNLTEKIDLDGSSKTAELAQLKTRLSEEIELKKKAQEKSRSLNESNRDMERKCEQLQETIKQVETTRDNEISKLTREQSKTETKLDHCESEIKKLKRQLREAEDEVSIQKKHHLSASGKASDSDRQIQDLLREVSELKRELAILQETEKTLKSTNKKLSRQMDDSLSSRDGEMARVQSENSSLTYENEELRRSMKLNAIQIENLEHEITKLNAAYRRDVGEEQEKMKHTIASLHLQIAELNSELSSQSRRMSMNASLNTSFNPSTSPRYSTTTSRLPEPISDDDDEFHDLDDIEHYDNVSSDNEDVQKKRPRLSNTNLDESYVSLPGRSPHPPSTSYKTLSNFDEESDSDSEPYRAVRISPLKMPNNAEIIKKRRARGSNIHVIQRDLELQQGFADNIEDASESESEVEMPKISVQMEKINQKKNKASQIAQTKKSQPQQQPSTSAPANKPIKRVHSHFVDPAFHAAALESLNDVSSGKDASSLPHYAEDVRDPNKLTVAQIKSWLTSIDVTFPASMRKNQLIELLRQSDPRL